MPKAKAPKKIFVLDTSVILHDHRSINHFEEHDVAIPLMVLEELDNFKRGNDSKNFEAREFIRIIDKLSEKNTLNQWITLDKRTGSRIKIHFSLDLRKDTAEKSMGAKADHRILDAALELKEENKDHTTVLVTKDINLRIKAKALGLQAEDYETGKVKIETDQFKGIETIEDADPDIIRQIFKDKQSEELGVLGDKVKNNQFYIIRNGSSSLLGYYNPVRETIDRVEKQFVYGIKPKNAEQTFAIHALLNDDIKLVSITGVAGTGKTLLALASALEQKNKYHQIVLARPIVPLSNKEIGYLPGSAQDKVNPYMAPLWDNLSYIKNQFKETEKKYQQIMLMQEEGRIVVSPLAFIRGRSLSDMIFIIDEAQNLTPHEVKTIVTRAGENAKLVFTGDVRQIDTPYLDEHSNGLSYLIDKLQGQSLYAHIHLEKGERSELANMANDLL